MIMKYFNIKTLAILATVSGLMACNPIEDQTLRDKYYTNAGTPITPAELTKHLTVTQPGETNDVVVLVNDAPSIGGVWHLTTATGESIVKSDNATYTYTSNGEFEVYMVAPSAGKLVESEHFPITVTDVYDPYVGMLTGAVDKFDKTAKKTWGFRPVTGGGADITNPAEQAGGYVAAMFAYGYWKYYPAHKVDGNAWWGQYTFGDAGDQKMVFEYDGTLTTYAPDGTQMNKGAYAVVHEAPDMASNDNYPDGGPVIGMITTTCPIIGSESDDEGQAGGTTFWITHLDSDYLSVFHFGNPAGVGGDWDDAGWGAFYKAVK